MNQYVIGYGRFDAYPERPGGFAERLKPGAFVAALTAGEFERPCRPCAAGEHDHCTAPSADDLDCCCDALECEP